MATFKLLLISANVLAQFHSATSPNARPPADQLRNQTPLERLLPHLGWISKIISCAWAALEVARHAPPTLVFVAGTFFTLAGALLRAHCFHALGRSFTFELAIRPAHVLVTGGVYAVVRHPSYTGIVALVVGWVLCLTDYIAWAADAWGGDGGVVAAVWVCVAASAMGACFVVFSRRMDEEDAMLEDTFGEEWRVWVKRVPYRLVPGVC